MTCGIYKITNLINNKIYIGQSKNIERRKYRHFHNYNDKNNVFINCKLNQYELKNGCKKIIKYKFRNKANKKITKKLEVKIPKDIKEEQKIIIHESGNYIKEKNKYSDLVINILVKGCRRK